MQLTVRAICHSSIRVRVVRRDFEYFWPYWKDYQKRFGHWERPIGKRTLKVVEIKSPGQCWEHLGFAANRQGRYPNEIRVLDLKLDGYGSTWDLRFFDCRVGVCDGDVTWFLHNLYRNKVRADVFPARYPWALVRSSTMADTRLTLPGGLCLNYRQASCLKIGQVLSDRRLRLEGLECITDGFVKFPLTRPHGEQQWDKHRDIRFAMGIKEENWKLFLRAIIGQRVSDIVELRTIRKRMLSIRRRDRDRERVRRVGQCFNGHKTVESVAVGRNLIFTLRRDEEVFFVVDSPEYATALYVFDRYSDAYSWASRKLDWREARKLARLVKVHRGAWRDAVVAAVGQG